MVAIKFFGLIVTFYLFVVLEAFEQNFYPARYGKREENEASEEKSLPEGKRIGRSKEQETIANRKIRFLISGGRFGKRGCTSDNCFLGSKEVTGDGFQTRQERSERIRIPTRKNQFMIGSRFGKRMENQPFVDPQDGDGFSCKYTGISDFYWCLNGDSKENDQFTNPTSVKEFFE